MSITHESAIIEEGKSIDAEMPERYKVPDDVISCLADGVVSMYIPDLEKVSQSIAELVRNQNILIETIQQENSKFTECQATFNLADVVTRAKVYQGKLTNIKKDMALLHEKTQKIKHRAERIQQQKEKESQQAALQKQQQIEREAYLIAKPAPKAPPPP